MAKQHDYTRYTIRVPSYLYDRVQAAADAAGRSVNAEILSSLELLYPPQVDIEARVNELIDELSSIAKQIAEDPLGAADRKDLAIRQQAAVVELHQLNEQLKLRGR